MYIKPSIVLCIVVFTLAGSVTALSTSNLNLDLDLNYTIHDLNASAPHLVDLLDKIETYSMQYLERDLKILTPHVEFLTNFWLPVEAKTFLNSVESFMKEDLSLTRRS